MQLDFAFLCDAATEHSGKLNALGIGIDRLYAKSVPVVHNRIQLVARFSFAPEEAGEHTFSIRVSDADGQPVGRTVEGKITLRMNSDAMSARANLLVDLVQLEFRGYGPHEAIVSIDGSELINLPLEVTRP